MKKGDLFPLAPEETSLFQRRTNATHHVQYTGEKRSPRKGEWYLSGAIVEGYLAVNNLSTPYHIGKLVRIKRETIITVIDETYDCPIHGLQAGTDCPRC